MFHNVQALRDQAREETLGVSQPFPAVVSDIYESRQRNSAYGGMIENAVRLARAGRRTETKGNQECMLPIKTIDNESGIK